MQMRIDQPWQDPRFVKVQGVIRLRRFVIKRIDQTVFDRQALCPRRGGVACPDARGGDIMDRHCNARYIRRIDDSPPARVYEWKILLAKDGSLVVDFSPAVV